jgi:hypothetical protein
VSALALLRLGEDWGEGDRVADKEMLMKFTDLSIYICIYIYTYTYIHIYIYIYRGEVGVADKEMLMKFTDLSPIFST